MSASTVRSSTEAGDLTLRKEVEWFGIASRTFEVIKLGGSNWTRRTERRMFVLGFCESALNQNKMWEREYSFISEKR